MPGLRQLLRLARRRPLRFAAQDPAQIAGYLKANPHDQAAWGALADELEENHGLTHWPALLRALATDGGHAPWWGPRSDPADYDFRHYVHPALRANAGVMSGQYTNQPVVQGQLAGLGAKVGLIDFVDEHGDDPEESPPKVPMASVEVYHKPPEVGSQGPDIAHAVLPAHLAQGLMHELHQANQGQYLQGHNLPGVGRWIPPEQRNPTGVRSVLRRLGRRIKFADAFGNATHDDFRSAVANDPQDVAARGAYADFLEERLFGPHHKPGDAALHHLLRYGLQHGFEPVPRPSAAHAEAAAGTAIGQSPAMPYQARQMFHGHLQDPRTGRHYWVASHFGAPWVHVGVTEEFPQSVGHIHRPGSELEEVTRTGVAHHGVVMPRAEAAGWARQIEDGLMGMRPDMTLNQPQVPLPLGRVMTPTSYHEHYPQPLQGALSMSRPIELEHTDPAQGPFLGRPTGPDGWGPDDPNYNPRLSRLGRLIRMARGRPADPRIGLPGESAFHPQELDYLLSGNFKQRYHDTVTASAENRPGWNPPRRELGALYHAGIAAHGGYEGVEHLARVISPHDAAAWGVLSGMASPMTKWEQHTGAGLAVLGEWINAGRPTDPRQIEGAIEKARQRVFRCQGANGKPCVRKPWAYALAAGDKRKKMIDFLTNHARYLANLGTSRDFIAQGWKSPNFAAASMPHPYADTDAVPIDYMMGLLTSPGSEHLRRGYQMLVTARENDRRKLAAAAKKAGRPFKDPGPYDPSGEVKDALEQHLKGQPEGTPLQSVVEAISRNRPGLRNPGDVGHQLIGVMKNAQQLLWADPQLSLAYKAIAADVAREHGVHPRQAMERIWATIAAVLGAKDLDKNGQADIARSLTGEAVRASWNPMEVLTDGPARAEFARAGVGGRNLDAFTAAVAQERARAISEHGGPVRVRPGQQKALESAVRRVPPGLGAGGGPAREALEGKLRVRKMMRRLLFGLGDVAGFRPEDFPAHGLAAPIGVAGRDDRALALHAFVPHRRPDGTWGYRHVRQVQWFPDAQAAMLHAKYNKGLPDGSVNLGPVSIVNHGGAYLATTKHSYVPLTPPRDVVAALEGGAELPEFDARPNEMMPEDYVAFARQVGLSQAVHVARSSSSLAVARAVSHALTGLGLQPHQVTRAVLNSAGQAVPAAVAAVHNADPSALQRIGGAGWLGLMQRLPGALAFTADPVGPDKLHRIDHQGPVTDLTQRLQAAGAYTHVLIPGRHGTTALVYDKGGRLTQSLQAAGLRMATAGGYGMPLAGRQELRDATRAPEVMG